MPLLAGYFVTALARRRTASGCRHRNVPMLSVWPTAMMTSGSCHPSWRPDRHPGRRRPAGRCTALSKSKKASAAGDLLHRCGGHHGRGRNRGASTRAAGAGGAATGRASGRGGGGSGAIAAVSVERWRGPEGVAPKAIFVEYRSSRPSVAPSALARQLSMTSLCAGTCVQPSGRQARQMRKASPATFKFFADSRSQRKPRNRYRPIREIVMKVASDTRRASTDK